MGRPRELSQEERADLLRQGYRPIEIWVPDLDNEWQKPLDNTWIGNATESRLVADPARGVRMLHASFDESVQAPRLVLTSRLQTRNRAVDWGLRAYILLAYAFVFAPIAASFVFSFNSDRFPSIPLGIDPPDHGRYRRFLNPWFTPVATRVESITNFSVGPVIVERSSTMPCARS